MLATKIPEGARKLGHRNNGSYNADSLSVRLIGPAKLDNKPTLKLCIVKLLKRISDGRRNLRRGKRQMGLSLPTIWLEQLKPIDASTGSLRALTNWRTKKKNYAERLWNHCGSKADRPLPSPMHIVGFRNPKQKCGVQLPFRQQNLRKACHSMKQFGSWF